MIKKINTITFFPILLAVLVAITPSILVGPIHESFALTGTTTTLHSTLNPSVYGVRVTFTTKVTPVLPGTGTPTGTVTFTIDGIAQPAVSLVSGHAFLVPKPLAGGVHKITVQYSGDANFTTSTSSILSQKVNKASTTTTLTSAPNPSALGQSVTFTANVAPVAPSTGIPSGTATFTIDGIVQPAVSLVSGQANLSSSTLSGGTHQITVQYSGSNNFLTSTSSILNQTVNTALTGTKTTLTSSLNPSNSSQIVTFTATVAPVSGTGTPTGTATFTIDGIAQPAVTLIGGQATMSTSTLSAAIHQIQAQYSGDTNFASSTSSVLNQTVNFLVDIMLHPTATCIPDSPCQFNPEDVNIPVGTTVFWKNIDTNDLHTVHADTNSTTLFGSPILNPGQTFSVKFTTPGANYYHCDIHPFMRGEVTVS